MEELHTDSIDGGHEASYGARSRARERAYSNNSHYKVCTASVAFSRWFLQSTTYILQESWAYC
jgi:hypothetical protein